MLPLTMATRQAVIMLRTWKKRRVIHQDARLKMLTEIMQGMRIIKSVATPPLYVPHHALATHYNTPHALSAETSEWGKNERTAFCLM